MMKFFYTIVLSMFLVSCAKENSDVFVPYPNNPLNDTVWTAQPAANASVHSLPDILALPAKSDSFDAALGASIKGFGDIEVTFPPLVCVTPGTNLPCVGKIVVEILYLRRKGDMVRHARPTTSLNRLLESGGAVYIRAFNNGQEVNIAPNRGILIKLREPNPIPFMKVFYGEPNTASENASFTWVPSQDSSRVSIFQRPDSSGNVIRGYDMFSQRFRWVNCDYFIDTNVARTRINALLPPNFTNTNTSMYAVFHDQKIVVRLNADVTGRSFFAINLPLNKNIALISLSKIGDDLYLGNKSLAISAGLSTHLVPEKKTKQQIIQFLENL